MNISVNQISKQYGQVQALKNISFQFPKGEISCLMGPSGCGKTTLLRLMMGLEQPDQGEISGIDDQKIGVVFQEDHLCMNLSAVSNISLVCSQQRSKNTIVEHLKRVGLADIQKRPVRVLSGGMRRRVAIVRAMLSEAEIIFMDEPFKGLDDKIRDQTIHYVKEMAAGRTIIFISHRLEEAKLMGKNIMQIK